MIEPGRNYGCWIAEEKVARWWRCKCSLCGTVKLKTTQSLKHSKNTHCRRGCQSKTKAIREAHSSEYSTWSSTKQRCENRNSRAYAAYGGRGIAMCERWRTSFSAFLEDMGPRPSKEHSLDRIDNDGDYSPENCRWAISKEQNRNTRQNRQITFGGVTKTLSEWAEDVGIHWSTLYYRLVLKEWPIKRALTEPCNAAKRRKT